MTPGSRETHDRATNHLALLARWADDLAHEIKNPFHAMVINLELVKRRAGDVDAATERAEVVESELHRVHGLIDSLLKVVRPWPEGDHVTAAAVFGALLPVFQARAGLHHIDYRHRPGDGPAGVPMPAADLALLLLNLVDNAVDAALDGDGTAGAAPDRWIHTAVEVGDHNVVIRVTDSGPGFPALDGDPFAAGVSGWSGRPGLGLAVSRQLVEAVGGTLVAEGERDDGTTVVARLPR